MKSRIIWVVLIFLAVQFAGAQTDSLNVSWNPNTEPDMYQYKLYRAINSTTNFQVIQSIPHPQTHTVDRNGILPGNLYAYTLAAMDSAGNLSDFSDTVVVGIPKINWTITQIPTNQTTTLTLADIFSDPDHNLSQLQITVSNVSHIQVSVTGNDLVLNPDPLTYTGTAQFYLKAEDPDGFWDGELIQLNITGGGPQTVLTLNIPPVVFPEDTRDSLFLDTCVTVSPYSASELTWQILDLDHLNADYKAGTRVVVFSSLQPNWFGEDSIIFQATAPDQTTKSTTVVAKVTPVNDAPVVTLSDLFISAISSNLFDLKQYATDVDNTVMELSWDFSPYQHFQITWDDSANKIIRIVNLDGTLIEDGYFIATDPGGASDTALVTLHYNPDTTNTPPSLVLFPPQIGVAEDSMYSLQLSTLYLDSTNTFYDLNWTFTPGENIEYQYDSVTAILKIGGVPDWSGTSDFTIKVTDPGGLSDQKTITVVVDPRVDLQAIQIIIPSSRDQAQVNIATDIPCKVEMSYWSNPFLISTYRVPEFDKQHSFVLSNLTPDTTYYYSLTLEDTSGFRKTYADSVFHTDVATDVTIDGARVIVYPNPYRPSRGHEMVVFENLPLNVGSVSIYTITGDLVYEQNLSGTGLRRWQWRVVNNSGEKLASGLYIYLVKDESGKKIKSGKVAVIR